MLDVSKDKEMIEKANMLTGSGRKRGAGGDGADNVGIKKSKKDEGQSEPSSSRVDSWFE